MSVASEAATPRKRNEERGTCAQTKSPRAIFHTKDESIRSIFMVHFPQCSFLRCKSFTEISGSVRRISAADYLGPLTSREVSLPKFLFASPSSLFSTEVLACPTSQLDGP